MFNVYAIRFSSYQPPLIDENDTPESIGEASSSEEAAQVAANHFAVDPNKILVTSGQVAGEEVLFVERPDSLEQEPKRFGI